MNTHPKIQNILDTLPQFISEMDADWEMVTDYVMSQIQPTIPEWALIEKVFDDTLDWQLCEYYCYSPPNCPIIVIHTTLTPWERSKPKCVRQFSQTRTGSLVTLKSSQMTPFQMFIFTVIWSQQWQILTWQSSTEVGNQTPQNHDSTHFVMNFVSLEKEFSNQTSSGM